MIERIQKLERMVKWLYCKVKNTTIGGIQSIVAGDNITVDNSDPANPVVSSTGGSSDGGVITEDSDTVVFTGNGTAGNPLSANGYNGSYSTTETLTGGTWIDGKPIYRKTVVFTGVDLTGGDIDLSTHLPNIETITPDTTIFTDWTSDNGIKSFGLIVSSDLHYWLTTQFLMATNFDHTVDFDLSLLDSISLTMSFTKTTDVTP